METQLESLTVLQDFAQLRHEDRASERETFNICDEVDYYLILLYPISIKVAEPILQ